MKVQSEIDIYERDGQDTEIPRPVLTVRSHWSRSDFVVLQIGAVKPFTVSRGDLENALRNAGNW